MSGLNAPDVPLYPAAQTGPPGVLDTPASTLELPTSGLDTVDHAVPFQFIVRVCGVVAPDGVS